jgi:hypothetical protein
MRLGRLPHNAEALAAAPAHVFGASVPPPMMDRSAVPFAPGLDGNDEFSDCTCVSLANMIRARAALNGFQAYVDPAQVVDFFAACAGNPPDLAAVDGLIYLDVVNRQATTGFATGHDTLFGIPGTVGIDRTSIAVAMDRLGSVGLGVTLHQRDMLAFQSGAVWDTEDAAGDVVGGHAVVAWDYTGLGDTDTVRIATWGVLISARWRWVEASIDEAHALAYPQEDRA